MKISLVEATRSGRSRAEDSEASAQVTGRGLPLGAGHGVPAGPSQNGLFELKRDSSRNGLGAFRPCLVACLPLNSTELVLYIFIRFMSLRDAFLQIFAL